MAAKHKRGTKETYGGRYARPFAHLARDASQRARLQSDRQTGAGGSGRNQPSVEITFADQGYAGEAATNEVSVHGVELHVVK